MPGLEVLRNRMWRDCQVLLYGQRTGTWRHAAGDEIRKGGRAEITKGNRETCEVVRGRHVISGHSGECACARWDSKGQAAPREDTAIARIFSDEYELRDPRSGLRGGGGGRRWELFRRNNQHTLLTRRGENGNISLASGTEHWTA